MGNKKIRKRFEKEKNVSEKIVTALVIFIAISFGVLMFAIYLKNSVQNTIEKNYSNMVVTSRKTKLYNKNKQEIGTVSKGYYFNLSKIKKLSTKNQYFNIKDTDYYLYYKDVKAITKKEDNTNNHYLVFNKNIKTKKNTKFYYDNKLAISIDRGVNLPIEYMDDKYYYVNYLGNLLQVKKDKDIEVIDNKNTEEKESLYISVLHFNIVYSDEQCKDNTCIKIDKVKEYAKYLKDNGYYSINIDQYKSYLDKNIRLKEKAILLTTVNDNDTLKKFNENSEYKIQVINDKTGLKFNDSNNKSTNDSKKDSIDRYLIKNNTSDDEFKRMVAGEEVQEIVVVQNANASQQSIPVINYHFFYDGTKEACTENICLDIVNFRQQLDYLRDNGYKTLTMDEFTKWMYGQIELPEKSVLLTIDDGAFGTGKHNGNHLIPILEEYKMHATLFLIAGWWDVENYRSKYLDIQSHTFDMHQAGSCGSGQVVCASKEELMTDLKKSLEIVDNNNSFCFPFYSYSDASVETVKEAGFKLAFIGGNRKAKRTDNKYLIPRYPIYKGTSLQQFINMVS